MLFCGCTVLCISTGHYSRVCVWIPGSFRWCSYYFATVGVRHWNVQESNCKQSRGNNVIFEYRLSKGWKTNCETCRRHCVISLIRMKETSSWNGRKTLQDYNESVQKGWLELESRENEAVDNYYAKETWLRYQNCWETTWPCSQII